MYVYSPGHQNTELPMTKWEHPGTMQSDLRFSEPTLAYTTLAKSPDTFVWPEPKGNATGDRKEELCELGWLVLLHWQYSS